MSTAAISPDPFLRAHLDAQKAVALFLPSLVGRPEPPPPGPPPSIQAASDPWSEGLRVAALVKKGEAMSMRVARGLPPEPPPPPTPEQQFGNQLDAVHIRALQEAIHSIPEEDRGKFISEAQDSAVKWIASHNGKVVVHGKVELAHSPESAERLAAKIVNESVEEHDQRKADEAAGAANGAVDDSLNAAGRPGQTALVSGNGRTDATGTPGSSAVAAEPAQPPVSPVVAGANGSDRGQPEVVPPGDGEQPAQGPPPPVQPQEAAKVGERKPDGHQITQPKNSVAANQKLAAAAAPELHQALSTLSAQVPGIQYARIRPQKSPDRLDQKLEDENDPDTLSDYLGAQLSADTPQAKDAMIAALKNNFKAIEVDDQFLTGRKDKAQYPSANVQVQLSNGATAEVQIVPREVQEATEDSHRFYKAGREAEEKGDNAGRDQQWAKAAEINQGQLEKFKARNGIGNQSVGGYEVLGDPITLGGHTFLRVKPGGQGGQDAPEATNAPPSAAVPQANQPAPAPASPDSAVPRAPGATQFAKGQPVKLRDGSTGAVAYVDPEMKFLRVRTADGRNLRQVDPATDLADAQT